MSDTKREVWFDGLTMMQAPGLFCHPEFTEGHERREEGNVVRQADHDGSTAPSFAVHGRLVSSDAIAYDRHVLAQL